MKKYLTQSVICCAWALVLFGPCGRLSAQSSQRKTAEQYIEEYHYAAMQEMRMYKIPASITLGQGLLESSCGNSRLAAECNNHFGIKCRKEWQGASCIEDDDAANECFRAYTNAMESYRDHSLFLTNSPRYQQLFTLDIMDYQSWAKGLKSAGYATNPQYAVILNNIIARYRLGKYDTMVILGAAYAQPQKQGVVMEHGIPAVFAQPGATPKDIAQTHQLGVWQIYRYNDLERGDSLRAGEVVYLKPKKRTATVPQHVYRQGESLRDISQKYGIKLKRVYHLNSLEPGEMLPAGTVLQLQKKQQHPVTQQPVFEEQVVEMPRLSEDTAGGLYTVKPGETLFGLAKRWGMEPARLAAINGLSAQAALKAGQLLVLRSDLKPQKTMIEPGTAMDQKKGVHVVMAGETLYSIARMYAVSVDSLRSWNLNLEPLQSGRTLRVSAAGPQKEQAALYYTVQPGDTAFSIAKKFGITLDELRLRNQLTDFQLRPGMQLNIK